MSTIEGSSIPKAKEENKDKNKEANNKIDGKLNTNEERNDTKNNKCENQRSELSWSRNDVWQRMPKILMDFHDPNEIVVDYALCVEYLI